MSTHWMVEAWRPDGWVAPKPGFPYNVEKWLYPAWHKSGVVARVVKDKVGQAKARVTHAEKMGFTVQITPMSMIPTDEYERLLSQRKRPKTDFDAILDRSTVVPEAAVRLDKTGDDK